MHRLSDYRNNCCAVALHEVSGRTEDEVVRVCLANSDTFARGRGMFLLEWEHAAKILGCELESAHHWDQPTLNQFCKANRRGTFLIQTRGHLLVIRDGNIIDPNWKGLRAARRRVTLAMLVTNAAAGRNTASSYKTRREAVAAARNPLPPMDEVTPVLVGPNESLMEIQPKKKPRKYDADPTFRFIKEPTTGRARSCVNYFVIELERYGDWMCLSECDQFGYTRKDFRNDARKERIEIKETN